MKRHSNKNTYSCSDGTRVSRAEIERRIRHGKTALIASQSWNGCFNFCEKCNINSGNAILDCAHIESVKSCLENGRAEKAWSVQNMKILCRDCHNEHDKTQTQWNGKC